MASNFTPTPEQKKVIEIKEGTHLVLASPGCGKTTLLAYRVLHAIANGVSEKDIICLTFTNRAAKAMKDKVAEKYPQSQITIGNIHHFCTKFLFKNKLVPSNTIILDEEDAHQLMEEIKTNNPIPDNSIHISHLIQLAAYIKQKKLNFPQDILFLPKIFRNIDQVDKQVDKQVDEKILNICKLYIKEKDENNYLDFDDLLTLTYYNLTNSNNDKFFLSQFKWLQVDEAQDLNPLQWSIINKITTPDAVKVFFGDYEQAIFSFMGAKLDSLHKLEEALQINQKNCIHKLYKNFRSPSYLLKIYIEYAKTHLNTGLEEPISNDHNPPPENSLAIYEINGTIEDEARYIAKEIIPKLLIDDDKTAIIVRHNKSADEISSHLVSNKIQHFKISGIDVFRRKHVKSLMAFFSVLFNEFDRMSWIRLLYDFKAVNNLKQSRTFINEMTNKNFTINDILVYEGKSSRLQEFFNIFENGEMIVFDTETTGLNIKNDEIIQIAAYKIYKGEIIDEFNIYIKTDKDIKETEKVNNISKDYLNKHGVEPKNGLDSFIKFCGEKSVWVAHNMSYDWAILERNLSRHCNKSISNYCKQKFDSLTIAKLMYPKLFSYNLKDLIDFLKIDGTNSHNAKDDVQATLSLIKKMYSDYLKNNIKSIQSEFFSNNISILEKFTKNFKEIYSSIESKLETQVTLRQAAKDYINYLNKFYKVNDSIWIEINKILNHFDYYTNKDKTETLREKIEKYIPEYKMFKEPDLYTGEEKVLVSTVYKAKGLEFDNVIVAEATDDVYPNYESRNPEEISEDARTFYVAMTRAKKKLFITSHTYSPWGHPKKQSRFIDCIRHHFSNT